MFKVRRSKGYHQWEEDEDGSCDPLMSNSEPALLQDGGSEATQFREDSSSPDCDSPQQFDSSVAPWTSAVLSECFYLGSFDMEGLSIRGRGCIDYPAGYVWQQTQQCESSRTGALGSTKPRQKNSWPSRQKSDSMAAAVRAVLSSSTGGVDSRMLSAWQSNGDYTTRFVRLVAERDELEILDDHTGEKVNKFNYRKISFVGTHPKHTRLFAFVAETEGRKVFCYAFKCESKESADKTACGLSDVFQRKIQEIKAKKRQQTIEITASATVLD